MPKAKPSQVILHRIELNTTERELLEQYVEAERVKDYAEAAKAAIIPVGIVVVGGVAYMIADGIWNFASDQWDRIRGSSWYLRIKTASDQEKDLISSVNPLARLVVWAIG